MSDAPKPPADRPRVRRRTVLATGAAGVVLAGTGAWAVWLRKPSLPDLDAAGLDPNAQDLVRRLRDKIDGARIDGEAFVLWVKDRERLHGPIPEVPDGKLHRLAQSVLLSTDFFPTGASRTRVAQYVSHYDPHKNPCYNPLRGVPDSSG